MEIWEFSTFYVFSEEPIIEKLLVSEKVEIDVVSFPFGDPLYHLTDDSFDTFAQLNGPVTLNLKAGVSARVTEVSLRGVANSNDESTIAGVDIFVGSEVDEWTYCGQANQANREFFVFDGTQRPIFEVKCKDDTVKSVKVRIIQSQRQILKVAQIQVRGIIALGTSCYEGNGATYRGVVAKSKSGYTCQKWSSQSPNSHNKTHENYPNFGLEGKYCRNPGGEPGPWCYTLDGPRFELCEVPKCRKEKIPEFKTREFRTTEGPPATEIPFEYDDIKNNMPPVLVEDVEGILVWNNTIPADIPYKVLADISRLENPGSSPLGFLAFAGYVDYSLGVREDGSTAETVERTTVTQDDIDEATRSFLRFNGFVENGKVTDEMVEFMKKDRCGNADMVLSERKGEECQDLKNSDILNEADSNVFIKNARGFTLPTGMNGILSADVSYYCQVDVKYPPLKNKRSRAMFMAFNYHKELANGHTSPLEIVALKFRNGRLCAQFLTQTDEMITTNIASMEYLRDACYTPTPNEMKTLHFKVRLDVVQGMDTFLGKVYVTVRGKDVAQTVYRTPIFSSVIVAYRDDQIMSLARLCKKKPVLSQRKKNKHSRKKRYVLSHHKWEKDEVKFNFQNYSKSLGKDEVRREVEKALKIYSQESVLKFTEVPPSFKADIVFMFIDGDHADGDHFTGTGDKAHAYSPQHGEVHFNNNQDFSIDKGDKTTSMFYVAAHEIGHALGIFHSENKDALMYSSYPTETAYIFKDLHYDDKIAMKAFYSGVEGEGKVTMLKANRNTEELKEYIPKMPLPTDCLRKIDAALSVGDSFGTTFLISGTSVWKLIPKDPLNTLLGYNTDPGYPQHTANIFGHGKVNAMFIVNKMRKDSLLFPVIFVIYDDKLVASYKSTNLESGSIIEKRWTDPRELKNVFKTDETVVDKEIKSAFQRDKITTILVASDLTGYYEITWPQLPGPFVPEKIVFIDDADHLIGKKLTRNEFNAAMPTGVIGDQLYVFGKQSVFLQSKFPDADETRVYKLYKIEELFGIKDWCTKIKE